MAVDGHRDESGPPSRILNARRDAAPGTAAAPTASGGNRPSAIGPTFSSRLQPRSALQELLAALPPAFVALVAPCPIHRDACLGRASGTWRSRRGRTCRPGGRTRGPGGCGSLQDLSTSLRRRYRLAVRTGAARAVRRGSRLFCPKGRSGLGLASRIDEL